MGFDSSALGHQIETCNLAGGAWNLIWIMPWQCGKVVWMKIVWMMQTKYNASQKKESS